MRSESRIVVPAWHLVKIAKEKRIERAAAVGVSATVPPQAGLESSGTNTPPTVEQLFRRKNYEQ